MNSKSHTWSTAKVIRETEEVVTIIFDTNGASFAYEPGQFMNVRQVIGDEAISRSYSLSSSPYEDERPAITIKKLDGGIMSNYIFRHAAAIKHWEVEGPHGSFVADPFAMNEHPVVLIGGGSGITPLYSILKSVLKHSHAPVILIDCNRTWNDVVFAKGITQLEQNYSGRLQVHHFLSREIHHTTFPAEHVRLEKLSKLALKKILKKLLADKIQEATYFLCGPSGLIDVSKQVLEGLEVPLAQIRYEHFSPPNEQGNAVELSQTTREVLLHFYDQTNLLEVQPGKTILDAALEDKIPLPYFCKAGTCGNCVARKMAGSLHMKNNYALTATELQQNMVLLCQSFPLDDEVIIAVG